MRRLVPIAAALLIAFAAQGSVATGEKPVTVEVDDSPFHFSLGVLPKTLSSAESTPAELRVSAELGSAAGLKELQLRLDRDIHLDASGIPPCTGGSRDVRGEDAIPQIEERCRESIVGRGDARMTIAFPDQTPIPIASDMVILRGTRGEGVSTLYALAYITVPTPSVIALTLKVEKEARGRYGTLVKLDVPVIAGGYGVIDRLSLNFNRRAAGGERRGVATATCARGSLKAEAVASFRDGASSRGESTRPCIPQ